MAVASNKVPGIDKFITDVFGVNRVETIHENRCVGCKQPVVMAEMVEIDQREYKISGLCSGCQAEVFGS